MLRDLEIMQDRLYDVLVVGGGIYGACVAWDATLRGLSVALVEKADFGHAASSNSLKIMHGGLRYLQDLDVSRMRMMARERKAWLRIAPRLVRPLPFILPTGGFGFRNRAAIRVALAVNDLISFDRNCGLPADGYIPSGRLISKTECFGLIPGLPVEGVTGAALWYDAQLQDSERLLMLILHSAVRGGAEIANYADLTAMQADKRDSMQAEVCDAIEGGTYTIRARLVINCAGAWSEEVLRLLNGRASLFRPSLAVNLVTRQVLSGAALALPSRFAGEERILFVVPWKNRSLIGTWHFPHTGAELRPRVTAAAIKEFLQEINAAFPAAALSLDDVCHVQAGFLPAHATKSGRRPPRLIRESQVCDHFKEEGLERMITVVGVKYTTARHAAQLAVDLALRRLGRPHVPCRTDRTELACMRAQDQTIQEGAAGRTVSGLAPQPFSRPFRSDGVDRGDRHVTFSAVPAEEKSDLPAQVASAVRSEMAQTLTDVLRRRTAVGAAGPPDRSVVDESARLMAEALGWTAARKASEVKALHESYEAVYSARDAG
ncbi:MAG TPA: FAD-dependent oxidoreductase [Acidobacteriota bacterium]|nr:FAD-dependent oxidoreductase [Acidobacteriota bacterium]